MRQKALQQRLPALEQRIAELEGMEGNGGHRPLVEMGMLCHDVLAYLASEDPQVQVSIYSVTFSLPFHRPPPLHPYYLDTFMSSHAGADPGPPVRVALQGGVPQDGLDPRRCPWLRRSVLCLGSGRDMSNTPHPFHFSLPQISPRGCHLSDFPFQRFLRLLPMSERLPSP